VLLARAAAREVVEADKDGTRSNLSLIARSSSNSLDAME
jgi:hypothetical protein